MKDIQKVFLIGVLLIFVTEPLVAQGSDPGKPNQENKQIIFNYGTDELQSETGRAAVWIGNGLCVVGNCLIHSIGPASALGSAFIFRYGSDPENLKFNIYLAYVFGAIAAVYTPFSIYYARRAIRRTRLEMTDVVISYFRPKSKLKLGLACMKILQLFGKGNAPSRR